MVQTAGGTEKQYNTI